MVVFFFVPKLNKDQIKIGCPATVRAPEGQKGIKEKKSAIIIHILLWFSIKKSLHNKNIPKNAKICININKIQYAFIAGKVQNNNEFKFKSDGYKSRGNPR